MNPRYRLLILVVLLLYPQISVGAANVIDFEGLPDSTILTNRYPGLIFSDAIILTAGITLNEFEFPPHSPVNVGSDNGGPMTITFASPIDSFSGYFTYSQRLTLQAYDANGHPVTQATSRFSNNQALSGVSGSSPNELISVTSQGGISGVTITGDPAGGSFVLDDATPSSTSPPATPLPPTLSLVVVGLLLAGIWMWTTKRRNRAAGSVTHRVALSLLLLLSLVLAAFRLAATPPSPVHQSTWAGIAIRALSVTPSAIPVRRPSQIFVTVHITDPFCIPDSVNVIRRNADGSLVIIARMQGRGNVYTAQPTFNETAAGSIQLQVSAAIRGRLRRSLSAPVTVSAVTRN